MLYSCTHMATVGVKGLNIQMKTELDCWGCLCVCSAWNIQWHGNISKWRSLSVIRNWQSYEACCSGELGFDSVKVMNIIIIFTEFVFCSCVCVYLIGWINMVIISQITVCFAYVCLLSSSVSCFYLAFYIICFYHLLYAICI